jgi:hypothetical protein
VGDRELILKLACKCECDDCECNCIFDCIRACDGDVEGVSADDCKLIEEEEEGEEEEEDGAVKEDEDEEEEEEVDEIDDAAEESKEGSSLSLRGPMISCVMRFCNCKSRKSFKVLLSLSLKTLLSDPAPLNSKEGEKPSRELLDSTFVFKKLLGLIGIGLKQSLSLLIDTICPDSESSIFINPSLLSTLTTSQTCQVELS